MLRSASSSLMDRFNLQSVGNLMQNRFSWIRNGGPILSHQPIYCIQTPDIDVDLPNGWEHFSFNPAGIETGLMRAHAKGEAKSRVIFVSGFKSDFMDFDKPYIHALQRAGVEVDIITLPDPGRQVGYMDDYSQIISDILTNTHDNISGLRGDIPHFIFTHSLGGHAFVWNMFDEEFADFINKNYAGGVHDSLHTTSPFRKSPLLNTVYSGYCTLFHDKAYGEAPLDILFELKNKIETSIKQAFGTPENIDNSVPGSTISTNNTTTTHGQILHSNLRGEAFLERMQQTNISNAAKEFPMIFLAGTNDFVSDPETIKDISVSFDARFFEFDAYHKPSFNIKAARHTVLNALNDMTDNWHKLRTPQEDMTCEFEDPMTIL